MRRLGVSKVTVGSALRHAVTVTVAVTVAESESCAAENVRRTMGLQNVHTGMSAFRIGSESLGVKELPPSQ
jgi:hypothetical protein